MIIELIKAFKDAYNKIYAEKIIAKKRIKEIEKLLKEWENRIDDIKLVEKTLIDNWHYLPIKQRKDYIQKTVDLIHYGFDIEYHDDGRCTYYGGYYYGLKKIYKNIVDVLQSYKNDMKHSYKNYEYDYVINDYIECSNKINLLMEKYGILEKSDNNVLTNELTNE